MARISTHVFDIARGKPGAGVRVDLYRGGQLIRSSLTNADGRTDGPLLSGEVIETGMYELVFHAAEYLSSAESFFEDITVRFRVTEAGGNYHVPLLLTPHS